MWRLSKQEHSQRELKRVETQGSLGEYFVYSTWKLGVQMRPPWGYLYLFTSSMDGGDLFDPTAIIAYLEYSLQISKIFTNLELYGTL